MSGTLQALVGTAATVAAAPIIPSMTIGARTVTYSAGKTFDYYDSAVTSATDVNITVNQDRACTISMCGAGGESKIITSGSGSSGAAAQTLTFTFTFKAGVTYVLRLGVVRGGGTPGTGAGYGGGYSALYLTSASSTNIIAVTGGGGGCAVLNGGTYSSGTGGNGGQTAYVAVTNGLSWAGANGTGAVLTNGGGGGGTASGGTAGGGTGVGTAGGSFSAGSGGVSGNYSGGGGGNGYYGGGGGGATSSSSSGGGGGGGSSFLYTASDSSGKTAVFSSTTTGNSGSFGGNGQAARPGFVGRGGSAGTSTTFGAALVYWSSFGNWRAPYPGGSAAGGVAYDCVLGADFTSGSTVVTLAWRITTSASSLASSSTLTFGADCRRLTTSPNVLEFTIAGTTYTKVVSSVSLSAITLTTTLGVDVPAGTQIYIYPVKSTVATAIGAINTGPSFDTSSNCLFRIAEPAGTYCYGFFPTGASWTGGGTTPLTVTLPQALYPIDTLPKGSIVQRSAQTNADTANSYGASTTAGACCGVIRITMS